MGEEGLVGAVGNPKIPAISKFPNMPLCQFQQSVSGAISGMVEEL